MQDRLLTDFIQRLRRTVTWTIDNARARMRGLYWNQKKRADHVLKLKGARCRFQVVSVTWTDSAENDLSTLSGCTLFGPRSCIADNQRERRFEHCGRLYDLAAERHVGVQQCVGHICSCVAIKICCSLS